MRGWKRGALRALTVMMGWLAGACGRPAAQPVPMEAQLWYDIALLASDALEGRAAGTPGELAAVQHITQRFEAVGLRPWRGRGWVQPFSYPSGGAVVQSHGNVVGALDVASAKTVVVGAHLDHLGWGGTHSRDLMKQAIHNGADDNASGVALMLGLARSWATSAQPPPFNLVFVAFSGEEDGLWGSQRLLLEQWLAPTRIEALVNFDMVGRMDRRAPTVSVEGVEEWPVLGRLLESLPAPTFKLLLLPITPGGSDHCTFSAQGIPVLSFSTGATEDYHRATDDVEHVNITGLMQLHAYLMVVLDGLMVAVPAQGWNQNTAAKKP